MVPSVVIITLWFGFAMAGSFSSIQLAKFDPPGITAVSSLGNRICRLTIRRFHKG